MIYHSINAAILQFIPKTSTKILDIGCGSGNLGGVIKQQQNCEVVGVTYSHAEATLAAKHLDQVFVLDLNSFDPKNLNGQRFDCVILSHVLEHLYEPKNFLQALHSVLEPNAKVIIALPNTLVWKQRIKFFMGDFKYTDGGILDKTHFRFYDWDTSLELVKESGYQIIERIADGYFPLSGIRFIKILRPVTLRLDQLSLKLMPGLFSVQFILVAQSNIGSKIFFEASIDD